MAGKAKKYRVGNPRNVSAGTHVMAYDDLKWFEGDDFTESQGFPPQAIQQYIDAGYIVEVEA